MGLYLAIFAGDVELEGVEIGSYADFNAFREAIVTDLECNLAGRRFPTLILHSDCDGEWSPEQAASLLKELETISHELACLPPTVLPEGWKAQVASSSNIKPQNLRECFFDIDGVPLLDRLIELARLSVRERLPILFQ